MSQKVLIRSIAAIVTLIIALLMMLFASNKKAEQERNIGYLNQAWDSAQSAQRAVEAAFKERKKLPDSNTLAGLNDEKKYASEAINSLSVGDDGIIAIELTEKLGRRGGKLYFVPKIGSAGQIEWRCVTRHYSKIDRVLKRCKYDENFRP